ncbi:MAG: succinylglutamate desuccinylase/aspartoacylase family protein [Candidatus Levybacteria bacterium]|nr:succinylglutamate desuccinylase/aspartoacylase family protein [Candidatus Levybacteria bacterium]
MDLIRRKHNNILLHRVNIGEKTISIPVAQLGSGAGKTILITAGLDGDEYAGIEAAYTLIDHYAKTKFSGRLIIIPILNIPGFEAGMSWNPLDNKYPKHIFPGKEKGSSSEKLMHWLSSSFIQNTDLWIDLHSGASTEVLASYIDIADIQRKNPAVLLRDCLQKIKAERIVLSRNSFTENIAKKNTAYIRLESGQLGQRNKKDIKQHIDWVKQIFSSFVIARSVATRQSKKKLATKIVYRNLREFLATENGIWSPSVHTARLQNNKALGEVRSLDGKILQKITAKENGVFLWRREAMYCKKGDSLYAYAYQKQSLSC